MRAVLYCRVSTKEQTENLSLSIQEKLCRDYCRREGFDVVRVFVEEGESAKTADRTRLVEMLAFCRSAKPRIDAVVVHSLSRFARNVADHHSVRNILLGTGTGLRSVTENIDNSSSGRLIETVIAALAQFDNDAKAERTIVGMKEANRRGRYTWVAPIGYLNSKSRSAVSSLIPDPERAPYIRKAFELAVTGNRTKEQILRAITALGLQTRTGRKLSPQTFNAVLSNPVYAGRLRAAKWGEEHAGDWEPLVSDTVFRQVQARYSVKRSAPKRKDNPDFPLRRFVRCGKCETPLTGSNSTGRSGRYAYYSCRKCGAVRTPKAQLEPAFISLLERIKPKPSYLRLFRAIVMDCWQSERQSASSMREAVEGRIRALTANLERLDQAFLFERAVDQMTYRTQRDRLRDELAVAELERSDFRSDELDVEGVLTFAEHIFGNLSPLWLNAAVADRRILQTALFPEGLSWDGETFGTAVTIPAFSWLREVSAEESCVASPTRNAPSRAA